MKPITIAALIAALAGAALAQEALPPAEPAPPQNAMVRFVHLSPNADATTLTLVGADEARGAFTPDGLTSIAFGDATDYVAVPAGDYDVVLGAATTGAAAPADPGAPGDPGPGIVEVRLVDGAIEMTGDVLAGTVTFEVTNDGSAEHDFAIEGVLEGTNGPLGPGESTTVTVELEPGDHRAYCPVGDHAEQGMELMFAVSEPAEAEDAGEEAEAAPAAADDAVAGRSGLEAPALEQAVTFGANRYYTVAIVGLVLPADVEAAEGGGFFDWLRGLFTGEGAADRDVLGLRLEVLEDDMNAFVEPDMTRFRVVHASPGTARLDVAVVGERGTLVRDIDFAGVSRYVNLEAADTRLEVRPTGSRAVVLDLAELDLELGMIHTVFVTGTPIEAAPLRAVVLSDTPIVAPPVESVDPLAPVDPAAPMDPVDPVDPEDEDEDEPEEEGENAA